MNASEGEEIKELRARVHYWAIMCSDDSAEEQGVSRSDEFNLAIIALEAAIRAPYEELVKAAGGCVTAVLAQSVNTDRAKVEHYEDASFAAFENLTAALRVLGEKR